MSRTATAWLPVLVAVVLTAWPADALANGAQTRSDGSLAAEPEIPAPQVRIEREVLVIDLHDPPGRSAKPRIEATYDLVNGGPAVVVPVRFVSAGAAAATVALDGQAIRTEASLEPIPDAWARANAGADRLRPSTDALAFTLQIPPGSHTLSVAYTTSPGWVDEIGEQATTVDYLLAPARHWGGFGVLHVRVRPPDGVEVTANVALQQVDGEYQGTFDGLPADALHVRARTISRMPVIVGIALGVVGFLGLVAWLDRVPQIARKRRKAPAPTALLLALASAGAFVVWMCGFTFVFQDAVYGIVFLGLPAAVVVAILTVIAVGYHARAANRAAAQPNRTL